MKRLILLLIVFTATATDLAAQCAMCRSTLENNYASDFAAVRRAQRAAEEEDRVEVWRGMDCIYSEYESRNHAAA